MVALAGALLILATLSLSAPAFAAHSGVVVVAQETGGGEGAQEEGGNEGQDDPDAETGADEEQSESATPEEGPPWTYQMARISLLGLAALLLACAYLYWRLVLSRRKGES
jgi:hypothetical protein